MLDMEEDCVSISIDSHFFTCFTEKPVTEEHARLLRPLATLLAFGSQFNVRFLVEIPRHFRET